jgi:hypothetical protein
MENNKRSFAESVKKSDLAIAPFADYEIRNEDIMYNKWKDFSKK